MAVILGLNCYKHDAAVALLIDGKLVAAAEEERFRRIKHYANYPEKAVDFVLESASISPS
ncbi:MAG: carbamoyltransferase, partial [Candidatus Aegiribacteria sp.]|nr:carbamoyltransferase [Candidatus Aegiribacteria sp.]